MADDDYELVVPFIVCASRGGPYDDEAFVAGYELGRLDVRLAVHAALGFASLSITIQRGVVPQLDLIAMRNGWRVTHVGDEHEGWVDVDFAIEPADVEGQP